MPSPQTIYRRLLRFYPARFREEYGKPLELQFLDDYRDSRSGGERAILWVGAIWDLFKSIPSEFLQELWQDIAYSVRIYRKRSTVTVVTLCALTLAIGAATGVFSVLNAMMLRGLPFREPERLVELRGMGPVNAGYGRAGFLDGKSKVGYLSDAAGICVNDMNLAGGADAVRVRVTETSANFFDLLGTQPRFGRAFAFGEDVEGRDGVAVIGNGLWQEYFGGDPGVLGSTIYLNGVPAEIIGVAPAGFDYPGKTAVWTPTIFDLQHLPKQSAYAWSSIGRLKAGVAFSQASAAFDTEILRTSPGQLKLAPPNRPQLVSLREEISGSVRQASLVLFATVCFVLLIACSNVAQLLLSRITDRSPEITVRRALGANRARLVQQLITEATVLTLCGSAAGIVVAHWASEWIATIQPPQLAVQHYTVVVGVLVFAVSLAILTGIIFGLLPASLIGRMQPSADIVRTPAQDRSAARMRQVLVGVQAVSAVILLAGSVTLGRSFLRILGTDLGFRTDHMVTVRVSLAGSRYSRTSTLGQYYKEALTRLRAVPGVDAAGGVDYLPLISDMFQAQQYTPESGSPVVTVSSSVTDGYFQTMGMEVFAGHDFSKAERESSELFTIVNEEFLRKAGVGTEIIGKKLKSGFVKSEPVIVGVTRNVRTWGPEGAPHAQIYFAAEKFSPPQFTFVARVRGDETSYLTIFPDVLRQIDPGVSVYDAKTLGARLDDVLAKPRFYATAVSFLGGFALFLAVIGVYGVTSHSIARRTKEIGLRLAVGASPSVVRGMLLRESLRPAVVGIAVGIALALELARFVQSLITSADPPGFWTCALAAALLLVSAAAGVWTASARVIRVDPVNALRAD
jgi:predicted permease